jgi:Tfp pilus assembly protein PilF
MSDERYDTAVTKSRSPYGYSSEFPLNSERYMDNIASVRADKDAIEALQDGDKYMAKKEYQNAQAQFERAVKLAPEDYAAHVMLAKCMLETRHFESAATHANLGITLYPEEPQAQYVAGFAQINLKQFDRAFNRFDRYGKLLPGNPGIFFFKGYCQEGMNHTSSAAEFYKKYLTEVQQGEYSKHAYERLEQWGYI